MYSKIIQSTTLHTSTKKEKELFIKDTCSILPFHFTASHTRVEVFPILSPTVYEIRNIKHT